MGLNAAQGALPAQNLIRSGIFQFVLYVSVFMEVMTKGGVKFFESTTDGPPDARGTKGLLTMRRFSMSEFAVMLSQQFRQPITDATGLKGRYDLHMDMTPYSPGAGADGPADPMALMITALQEQLGLKFESRKDGLDVLVVDHAEKTPTAN